MNFQDPWIASGKKKSFTLDQLAKELQVTQQTVSRWEYGAALPSRDSFRRLSQLYRVSFDYFVDEKKEKLFRLCKKKIGTLERTIRKRRIDSLYITPKDGENKKDEKKKVV